MVEHPGSPLLAKVDPDLVERNLQWKIQIQNENGSWAPHWEWGQFPGLWEEAKTAWSGIITVRNLIVLRNFGRIEGLS